MKNAISVIVVGGDDGEDLQMSIAATDLTPEMRSILKEHLPKWLELFATKNAEYGGGSSFELGPRGQFSDMYRKMIKLKRGLWEDKEDELVSEGVDEILLDFIGHCFLTLVMRSASS